ncbi:MAG: glycosyl hydrolase-related protein [Candidatus Sericytochromatia bacterium]|nr:glycosyl hydrolase-related protein [Candidatus Sericytochromatia bacterium]
MTTDRAAPRPLLVVPHTHWDREWYRTFEQYRYRLVATLDAVLESDLPHFMLDGQTAVVEDYLALRPERRASIAAGIADGRLAVGPWFVLVDEFLVSGEALVRNLLVGRATMTALGADPSAGGVGYLPDMFGHIAQMPQLLAGFGLGHAVVWRGATPSAPAFWWEAPDGTRVRAAWLPQGYYQTLLLEDLGDDERAARLATYAEAFAEAPAAWLLAGADHMAPRPDTADLVAGLASRSDAAWQPTIAPLSAVFAGEPPTACLQGELRATAGLAYLLPGVLSTRVHLKQRNARLQALLERYVEPITALAWWGGAPGADRMAAALNHAWRTLMLNHPHDSICGCSIDAVHREMLPRFEAAEQVAEEVLADAVRQQRRPSEAPWVYLFNGGSRPIEGPVEVTLDWAAGPAPAPEALLLVDEAGREAPCLVLDVEDAPRFAAEPDLLPDWYPARRFHLVVQTSLPAMGGAVLRARPAVAGAPPPPPAGLGHDPDGIENAWVRLEVRNGRVDLLDRRTGRTYRDVHGFEDEADAGDCYNFSPVAGDVPRLATYVSHRVVPTPPQARVLEVVHALEVPVGLTTDRQARSDEVVRQELVSRFRLTASTTIVAVETQLVHGVRDHRLRLRVGGAPREAEAWVEGAYGVFRHDPVPAGALPAAKGTEAIRPERPQAGFTALVAPDGTGLALLAEGLHEVELPADGPDAVLRLTLLRAVGWLSRDDLRTRGGGAGPRFEVPEAQCQGPQVFRTALAPLQEGRVEAVAAATRWAHPPRAWQGAGPAVPAPGLRCDQPAIAFSALKRSVDGRHLVLRAHNTGDTPVVAVLSSGLQASQLQEARLDETPLAQVGDTTTWHATFRPYEIRTWLLTP